jgi:pilus biogenesis lipoprotein CpaD
MTEDRPMTAANSGRMAAAARATKLAAAAALLALGLAGCGTTNPYGPPLADYQGDARDLIAVAGHADQHLVAGRFTRLERDRLAAFIASAASNRPESLRVTLHGRTSPGRLREIVDALVADGVDPRHIVRADPWLEAPPPPAGAVLVAVERAIAVQPDCPGWLAHVSAPEDNRTNPDFGCSNVTNFAAMLGDPHHLRQGASSIYTDGEVGALSVADYRADKIKELPKLRETQTAPK